VGWSAPMDRCSTESLRGFALLAGRRSPPTKAASCSLPSMDRFPSPDLPYSPPRSTGCTWHWKHALDIRLLCIDNAEVVRCLTRAGVYSTSAGRQCAHLWRRIWHRLEDIGYQTEPGSAAVEGKLVIAKVKAHKKASGKASMAPNECRLCELNELADHWAKAGAELAAPPSWQAADAKSKLDQAKRALEFVAAFCIAATDVVHTLADLDEANAAERGAS
jgi:hypothetical protein